MSGFWKTGDSSSECSDSESGKEEVLQQISSKNFFIGGSDSSSSEDNRVVKTKESNRFNELVLSFDKIKDFIAVEDYVEMQKEFEKFCRIITKSKTILDKSFYNKKRYPSFLIKGLLSITDHINQVTRKKKEMTKLNAKALIGIKSKLKVISQDFNEEIEKFKTNPYEDLEEDANSESEEDKNEKKKKKNINLTTVLEKKVITVFEKEERITAQLVSEKLNEVSIQRGLKRTVLSELIERTNLIQAAIKEHQLGAGLYTKSLCLLILIRSDNVNRKKNFISHQSWHMIVEYIDELITYLDHVTLSPKITYDEEVLELTKPNQSYQVKCDLVSFLEKLFDLFVKSLQSLDPHTQEYSTRLKDEQIIYKQIHFIKNYVEKIKDDEVVCRYYMLLVSLIYYKNSNVLKRIDEIVEVPHDPQLLVKLCQFLYASNNAGHFRTRAILCHTYHLALHDCWKESRDLLLMSHLQETIGLADVETQILFNRVLIQLGLCAFRNGKIQEAYSCLNDIYTTGRMRELLAQGVSNTTRQNSKTAEQISSEKLRQIPFHMHINLELIECVFLTCAIFIPKVSNPSESKKKNFSKHLRRLFEQSSRQIYIGPPENTREHMMAASQYLWKEGDWKNCYEHIFNIKVWTLFSNINDIKEIIKVQIQEAGLQIYLFLFGYIYDSIDIETLSGMFNLSEVKVQSFVTKLIIKYGLRASWDETNTCLVMDKFEQSQWQHLAKQLANISCVLVENNEKVLDILGGNYGFSNHFRVKSNSANQQRKYTKANRLIKEPNLQNVRLQKDFGISSNDASISY